MFQDDLSQKFFIDGFLIYMFELIKKRDDFHRKLKLLAERHYERGVKAVEYGIVGEVNMEFILILKTAGN